MCLKCHNSSRNMGSRAWKTLEAHSPASLPGTARKNKDSAMFKTRWKVKSHLSLSLSPDLHTRSVADKQSYLHKGINTHTCIQNNEKYQI